MARCFYVIIDPDKKGVNQTPTTIPNCGFAVSGDCRNAFVRIPVVDCKIQACHSCVLDLPGHLPLDLVVFDSNSRLDCAGCDPNLPYCALQSCGVHFVR